MNRLDEIEQRWQQATPGPWKVFELVCYESVPHGDWLEWAIAPANATDLWHDRLACVDERTRMVDGKLVFSTDIDRANAEAIAHAPEDVAYLLAEVRRLQIGTRK